MMTSIPNSIISRRRLSPAPRSHVSRPHRPTSAELPPLPATEEIITIRPFGPFNEGSLPSSGPNACVAMIRPDDVDVHLAAEFVGGKFQHRPRDRDAGVVDQPGERFAVERGADLARGRQHLCFVGDVEQQRGEIGAEFGS